MNPTKYYREERRDNIWSTPSEVVTARTPALAGGIYFTILKNNKMLDYDILCNNLNDKSSYHALQ